MVCTALVFSSTLRCVWLAFARRHCRLRGRRAGPSGTYSTKPAAVRDHKMAGNSLGKKSGYCVMFTVLRFFMRGVGCFLLAAALVAIIADGSRTIAQSELALLSAGEFWSGISSESLAWVRSILQQSAVPFLGDIVFQNVLNWPLWLVCSLMGFLCLWLGQSRKRSGSDFMVQKRAGI